MRFASSSVLRNNVAFGSSAEIARMADTFKPVDGASAPMRKKIITDMDMKSDNASDLDPEVELPDGMEEGASDGSFDEDESSGADAPPDMDDDSSAEDSGGQD